MRDNRVLFFLLSISAMLVTERTAGQDTRPGSIKEDWRAKRHANSLSSFEKSFYKEKTRYEYISGSVYCTIHELSCY